MAVGQNLNKLALLARADGLISKFCYRAGPMPMAHWTAMPSGQRVRSDCLIVCLPTSTAFECFAGVDSTEKRFVKNNNKNFVYLGMNFIETISSGTSSAVCWSVTTGNLQLVTYCGPVVSQLAIPAIPPLISMKFLSKSKFYQV